MNEIYPQKFWIYRGINLRRLNSSVTEHLSSKIGDILIILTHICNVLLQIAKFNPKWGMYIP